MDDPRLDQRCKNCRFWHSAQTQCRRHAPSIVSFVSGAIISYPTAAFPTTMENYWCGDWEAGERHP